jgi:N-acetyl sugar amidotransferase
MDTSDSHIQFDENGVCSHCNEYDLWEKQQKSQEENDIELERIVDKIKRDSKNKEFDCILGLSGGVDSSYLAYITHKLGLRVLLVHFDNGWNSEVAVNNIEKIINKFNAELYTYVVDWEEFREIQKSFFKAGVVDVELITDNAIVATVFKIAAKYNIKYVISGNNKKTEPGNLPKTWRHNKLDKKNIYSIHKAFSKTKIKSLPTIGIKGWWNMVSPFGVKYVMLLNLLDYDKQEATDLLKREFDWKEYGEKHYESLFTKFYQAFYLPEKFGIDKRRLHLSVLVRNGQINKKEALDILSKPLLKEKEKKELFEYVLEKLNFTEQEFEDIMKQENRSHFDYPNSEKTFEFLNGVMRFKNVIKGIFK